MHSIYADYLDRLDGLHMDIIRAIDGLPQEALDWVPGLNMNSLCVLIVHLTGAERYWLGDVTGQDLSDRDRGGEFLARELDEITLKERLLDSLAYARDLLETLTLEDLDSNRTSPRDGRTFTVAWSIFHALEHTAIHVGHIQMVRQLWEQRGNN